MESKGVPFSRECRVIEVCNPQQAQEVLTSGDRDGATLGMTPREPEAFAEAFEHPERDAARGAQSHWVRPIVDRNIEKRVRG